MAQTSAHRDTVRHELVRMLPRLKRFADVLVGEKTEGKALLRRALFRMLDGHHRYQRGTLFDRWAFSEVYALWLGELRDHAAPLRQAKTSEDDFAMLFPQGGGGEQFDAVTANFPGSCRPSSGARCSSSTVKVSTTRTPAARSTRARRRSRGA
jgi:DNA-directed RNA polymerase specialized sigma24 family protein